MDCVDSSRLSQRDLSGATAQSLAGVGQTEVSQGLGTIVRVGLLQENSSSKVVLFERTLVMYSGSRYSGFFKDIYSELFNVKFDLKEQLFHQIFCESANARELPCFKGYCMDLFKMFSLPKEINSGQMERFRNFFDKIKLPLEIAIWCRKSLIAILQGDEEYRIIKKHWGTYLHASVIMVLGKLAKSHEDNVEFFAICYAAILRHINMIYNHHSQSNTHYLLGKVVETFCEFSNDASKSYELIVQMLGNSDHDIRRQGIEQLGMYATRYGPTLVYQPQPISRLEDNLKLTLTHSESNMTNGTLLNIGGKSNTIQSIQETLTFNKLFEIQKYLEVIVKLSIDNYDFLDYLMDQIVFVINYDGGCICFFTEFIHKYSPIHLSIAKKSFDVLFSQLENPVEHIQLNAARELTKLVCASTNLYYRPYFERATIMLEDENLENEARKVIAHYLIHGHLSSSEKGRYLTALIETVNYESRICLGEHPVIDVLKSLVEKKDEKMEIRLECLNNLLRFLKHKNHSIRYCAMMAIGKLGAEITSFGENLWKESITGIAQCKDYNKNEALGKFALYCGGRQEILAACSNKIFKLIIEDRTVLSKKADIEGIKMLMNSAGINNDIIQECLRLSALLINDSCDSKLITGIRNAAQFWHKDTEKYTLIFNYLKTIAPKYPYSRTVFKELQILAETPGIGDTLKRDCYMAILDALKDWNYQSAQECIDTKLKNNALSQEIIIEYLKQCIPRLIFIDPKEHIVIPCEAHSVRLSFINVCLYYEQHTELLTKEVQALLTEGKEYLAKFPAAC